LNLALIALILITLSLTFIQVRSRPDIVKTDNKVPAYMRHSAFD
jgi:hypothetical protein